MAIAWADRSLCGHCTGPFRLLPAVRRAILHYLPCGSHYLLWTDMDSHCGHCAGIICHPWACEVVVQTVGHCAVIFLRARWSHNLPCAMLHYIICRTAAIVCYGQAWAVIVVIARALSAILGHVWSLYGQLGHFLDILRACWSHYLPCTMLHYIIFCAAATICLGRA